MPQTAESPQVQRPQWRSLLFVTYCAVGVWGMTKVMLTARTTSTPEGNPQFAWVQPRLSPGWLPWPFPALMDNSDAQYRSFRGNVPSLIAAAAAHEALAWALRWLLRRGAADLASPVLPRGRRSAAKTAHDTIVVLGRRLQREACIRAVLAAVFLVALHGGDCVKLVALSTASFLIGNTLSGSRWNPALTWALNLGLLFAVDWLGGLRYADAAPMLAFLDGWRGFSSDWHVYWRFSALRLISYNLDVFWSQNDQGATTPLASPVTTAPSQDAHGELAAARVGQKQRSRQPRPPEEYNWVHHFSYVYYTPLYLAGPILSFNDYMAQCSQPVTRGQGRRIGRYVLRLAATALLFEAMLHVYYAVAIGAVRRWDGFTPLQLVAVGYVSLNYIWLKLLVMWRFFRAWALINGVEAPENMTRCMSNHVSAVEFWRHWHVSYNRWLVRYMYIPMGGSRGPSLLWRIASFLLIFSFVAVWHDISLNLLAWGWLITLFILPEMLVVRLCRTQYLWSPHILLWRFLAGVGATYNILTMSAANLVGYAVGVDGTYALVGQLLTRAHILTLVGIFATLFSVAQVTIEFRHAHLRRESGALACLWGM